MARRRFIAVVLSLLVLLALILLAVTDTAEAAASKFPCKPAAKTNKRQCNKRRKNCPDGVSLKFMDGCRIGKKNKRAGDGGCQCIGYCGYLCRKACVKDKQCEWRYAENACYNRDGTKGAPMPECAPAGPTSTPSAAPSSGPTWSPYRPCFHVASEVELESGERRRMDELRYGDRVKAVHEITGEEIFSPVVAFTGAYANVLGEGVEVIHEHGRLVLSPMHIIYAAITPEAKPAFVETETLVKGSVVFFNSKPSRVLEIRVNNFRGWYTPLTKTGTIVVNGLTASCHTGKSHFAARLVYRPLTWLLEWFPRPEGSLPLEGGDEDWFAHGIRRTAIGKALSAVFTSVLQ